MGLGLFILLSAAGAATPCYPDEPQVVTVTGILQERGKHNYGYFVLTFKPPICTLGAPADDPDPTDEPHATVTEMQLVFLEDAQYQYGKLRPSLGKKVQCTGQLFDAQTAGHRTPVLVQVMHKDDCHAVE